MGVGACVGGGRRARVLPRWVCVQHAAGFATGRLAKAKSINDPHVTGTTFITAKTKNSECQVGMSPVFLKVVRHEAHRFAVKHRPVRVCVWEGGPYP